MCQAYTYYLPETPFCMWISKAPDLISPVPASPPSPEQVFPPWRAPVVVVARAMSPYLLHPGV